MTTGAASIVIIDDEERIRQLLSDFLEDFEEFSLRACDSAESALDELAREQADLCIVDMRLPGMNGQDFILAARERGLCPRFILHTGSMDFSITEPLRRLGIHERDLFLKPCGMNDMLTRIHQLLAQPGN